MTDSNRNTRTAPDSTAVIAARIKLIQWCLRRVANEYGDEPMSHELEYCDDMIEDAARTLVATIDNQHG